MNQKVQQLLQGKGDNYIFPKLGDFGKQESLKYKDDIYVGYRYYGTRQVTPLICFGHGLSYTEFEYGEPAAAIKEAEEKVYLKAGEEQSITITLGKDALGFYEICID